MSDIALSSTKPFFIDWKQGTVVDSNSSEEVKSQAVWDRVRVESFAYIRNFAKGKNKRGIKFEYAENGDDSLFLREYSKGRIYGFAEFVRRDIDKKGDDTTLRTTDSIGLHMRILEGYQKLVYKSALDIRMYDENGVRAKPDFNFLGGEVNYVLQERIAEMHRDLFRRVLRI